MGACGPCSDPKTSERGRAGEGGRGMEASLDGQVGRGQAPKCIECYNKELGLFLGAELGLEGEGSGQSQKGPSLS